MNARLVLFAALALTSCGAGAWAPMHSATLLAQSGTAPSFAAQHDLDSINQSLKTLPDSTAQGYVGYALANMLDPQDCLTTWPDGIDPTVPEVDKFYSGCWLLKDPTLTPEDVGWIISQLPQPAPSPSVARPH